MAHQKHNPNIGEHLESEEALYTLLANSSPIGSYIVQDKRFLFTNPRFQEYTGYTEDELLNIDPLMLVHPEDRETVRQNAIAMLKGNRTESYEFRLVTKNGEITWALETATPIPYNQKKATLGNLADITERKQAEARLLESEEKYRSLVSNIPDLIWSTDFVTSINYANTDAITGYTIEELSRSGSSLWLECIHPDDLERFQKAIDGLTNKKKPFDIEIRFRRKDGEWIWLNPRMTPFLKEDGTVYYQGITSDITERKHAERELQVERDKAQHYLDISGTIVVALDATGKVTLINKQGLRVLEYEEEEVLGKNWFDHFIPKRSRREIRSVFDMLMRGEVDGAQDVEGHLVVTKSGQERTISWHNSVLRDENGNITGTLSSGEDITDQLQRQKQLEESDKRFRELAELLPQCVGEFDTQGNVLFANRNSFEKFGYTPGDLDQGIGFLNLIVPEDHDRAIEDMAALLRSERVDDGAEYTAMRKDATTFPIMIWSTPIFRDGQIVGVRCIAADISDQKRAEQEAARAEAFKEMDRLKTILLASVSHELRTPLAHIKGLASTLLQPNIEWDRHTQQEFLFEIDQAVNRLTHIVSDLIDMSHLEAGTMRLEKTRSRISAIVNQIHHQLIALTSNHEFEMRIEPDLPPIYCDEVRIGQVIINLVSNAVSYSDPGTKIILQASVIDDCLEVSVTDQGIGIPEDKLESVFERFSRLENGERYRKEGNGLGLAISKAIIAQHKGQIRAESEQGNGSRFIFTIPISKDDQFIEDLEVALTETSRQKNQPGKTEPTHRQSPLAQ